MTRLPGFCSEWSDVRALRFGALGAEGVLGGDLVLGVEGDLRVDVRVDLRVALSVVALR